MSEENLARINPRYHHWFRNPKMEWQCMRCGTKQPSTPLAPALNWENEQKQDCNQIIAAKIHDS